jgi:predicted N-acetyltransferase YhbS
MIDRPARPGAACEVVHLFERPALREAVAGMIWREFWTEVPEVSITSMAGRLAQATRADAVPLCLVALDPTQPAQPVPIGVVNLVDHDDDKHLDWTPWLAGLVVAPAWRGHGVGTALVRRLLAEAGRLAIPQVYLGTDGPGFYTRLGARLQQQHDARFQFLRFDLGPG